MPLNRMPDGYDPPMSADEALALYEAALASLDQSVRAAATDAWERLPDDPAARVAWIESCFQSVDAQWGEVSDMVACDYVVLNRAAHGFEPGTVVHSDSLSSLSAGHRGAEILRRLDADGEQAAYGLFVRRMTSMVMNRARSAVRRSAAAAGSGWCRVPERGACWWCLMLASRGAVYESEQTATGTASGGARYHAHCRCTAVEVLDGEPLPARARACVDWYTDKGHFTRDDVESGDFTRATGIPSTSIEERDDKRLGRSRVPDGFTPVLDPAVPTTGVPIVSADDIDVATRGRTITRTRSNGTTVTRYRGGHAHGTGFPGKTEFPPGWTEDDIALAFQLAMACPQWTSLAGDRRRYRRDVHGVIVEVTWYPGPDGAPVIGHCYPLCGAGVIVNSPQGPVAVPWDIGWLDGTIKS